MEGKKYNLEKASTEATKLQKKVSSGVALNYTEAENQLTEEELKQKIILHLKRSDIERAIGLLQKNINYRDNILSSSEVKELIYDRYKWLLSKKNDTQAKKLESFIQLTPEEQLKIKITDLLNALKTEKFDPKSLEGLNITDLEKHDSLVQAQVIEIVKKFMKQSRFDDTAEMEKFFEIPKEIVIDELLTKYIKPYNNWGRILTFKEKFSLPESIILNIVKSRVLSNSYNPEAMIVELERDPEIYNKLITDEEVISKITEPAAVNIASGNFESVSKLFVHFNLPEIVKIKIDEIASLKISKYNLIKFVRHLSVSSEASISFPKTMEKARAITLEFIQNNLDLADYFIENLDKYYLEPWTEECAIKAASHYSVAQKILQYIQQDHEWNTAPWINSLIKKAETTIVENSGHGVEKFKEHDPYENHQWLFNGYKVGVTQAISNFMAGEKNFKILEEFGINIKKLGPTLTEANEKIDIAYKNFLEQIRINPNIREEDKLALLNPESSAIKMTPLLKNIRSFVARYIVQSISAFYLSSEVKLPEVSNLVNNLDPILTEGFNKYIKIHEVDIPLYDKLYEEFDDLRETGRYPLEVFLGRDGIYAWIGRHSQDVARLRKMGLEKRKKLKEVGEVIEINPQYVVYPRYFRDNIDYKTKRQFLEQEGISPSADPLFYDTGYTGTIPEQIMRIMDFSEEDIEQRIRLLSAPSAHRRVKGIPENAREEIIEYIEHNAKSEETAEGLIIDNKSGKIRHIAKPTNPEEQFYFMMVKQAVARHYWLQEKLHHEPSGNINLDSEHYTIRVRQEYAKFLPKEFIDNPKEFFAQHGELLKGSNGQGQYPDEEIVLFKLSDSTEIVAKRVELRKAKEARKEFSILISAKKAGLPTADPVGFLSGKEDNDGSYLLMKKIEGISGRNFDKYLRALGKFSEERIKNIMHQVAEKNREMAELFRNTLKIDKRWRIKDTIIELNKETGEVENVIPIDWERAQNFDPTTPKEIDEII